MQCHVIQGAGRMRLRLVVHELRRILFHRLALTGTESWWYLVATLSHWATLSRCRCSYRRLKWVSHRTTLFVCLNWLVFFSDAFSRDLFLGSELVFTLFHWAVLIQAHLTRTAFQLLLVLFNVSEQSRMVGQVSHRRIVQDIVLYEIFDCLKGQLFHILQLVIHVREQSKGTWVESSLTETLR